MSTKEERSKQSKQMQKYAEQVNTIAKGVDLDTVIRGLNTYFRERANMAYYQRNCEWTFEFSQQLRHIVRETGGLSDEFAKADRPLEQSLAMLFYEKSDRDLTMMNLATHIRAFDDLGRELATMIRSDTIPLHATILEARQRKKSPVPEVLAEIKRNDHNLGSFVGADAEFDRVNIRAKGRFHTEIHPDGQPIFNLEHELEKGMERILKAAVFQSEREKLRNLKLNISQDSDKHEFGKY